ncbi:hypothetical protein MP638_006765 [Amoeboaphelidium occidentale]|nr:hypothetical protein MP638_006765 [Amoeboaphelidium occidentale]
MPVDISINLGNARTSVCIVNGDAYTVLADEQGHREIPSVVALTKNFDDNGNEKNEVLIGHVAQSAGRNAFVITNWVSMLSEEEDNSGCIECPSEYAQLLKKHGIAPEIENDVVRVNSFDILTLYLGMLKSVIDAATSDIGKVAFSFTWSSTLSATTQEKIKTACVKAGICADIELITIVPEYLASIYENSLFKPDEEDDILVLDFGSNHTTFHHFAVRAGIPLSISSDTFKEVNTSKLIGILTEHFVREFKQKSRLDINESKRSKDKLKQAVSKYMLTSGLKGGSLVIESLMEGVDYQSSVLNSVKIQYMMKPIVDQILNKLKQFSSSKEFNHILLTGNSHLLFDFEKLVKDCSPSSTIVIDSRAESPAIGSIRALQIANSMNFEISKFTDFSIGVKSKDSGNMVLFKKNYPLPAAKKFLVQNESGSKEKAILSIIKDDNVILGEIEFENEENGTEVIIYINNDKENNGCSITVGLHGETIYL